MKKIFLMLFLLLVFQMCCFAQEGISFVYINGSNNNDAKMKKWYENGVKNLHPYMKKSFENNPEANKYFLKNNQYFIEEKPVIFFWGDRSRDDLKFVENDLALSKNFSPWLAYQIRSALTHYLHDAIWVQKYHNMLPILEDLHANIKAEEKKGNKVVLFGYSAGSFVTYEYLFTRLPYINVKDFFDNVDVPQSEKDFVAQHPMKNTCITALGQELAVFSAAGHIIPNDDNQEIFRKDYMDLDNLTNKYCDVNHTVKGIVNFATPLVLFYSDLSDPNFQITYYNRLLFKYLIENDMFWITFNYREDPLGFPGGRNLSVAEVEELTNMKIEHHAGFMYDLSDVASNRTPLLTHTSYWSTRKKFSKAVVRAYVNGYEHEKDDSYKKPKILKKYINININLKP